MKAAAAFWTASDSSEEQDEAVMTLATHLNARASYIRRLPIARRTAYLAHLPKLPRRVWSVAILAYHSACKSEMLETFLNEVKISHDKGIFEETNEMQVPCTEVLQRAVEVLRNRYNATDVAVYLLTLSLQSARLWSELPHILEVQDRESLKRVEGSR
jgi:hypothetical protein